MKKTKKVLAVLLAALLAVTGLTACSGGDGSSTTGSAGATSGETGGVYDTTITVAFTTAWDSLMPYASASGSMYTKELVSYIYDRLAFVSDGGTKL